MFISRLVAFLFVLLVGLFVGLATALKDPADSANRLPVALDIKTVELGTERFDALAGSYSPFDASVALDMTRDLIANELVKLVEGEFDLPLSDEEISDLVRNTVEQEIDAARVEVFHGILTLNVDEDDDTPQDDTPQDDTPQDDDTPQNAEDKTTENSKEEDTRRANVLALTPEEQRIANFGDAVGKAAIQTLINMQGVTGALTRALKDGEFDPITSAIRPRLTRIQRVAYKEIHVETYAPVVEVSGSTTVNRRTDIRARTGGPVAQILTNRGDQVTAGETLLVLDEDGRNAQRLQALASIAQAEAGLAQAQANLISGEAAIASALAQVAQAETSLNDAKEAQADITDLGDFASATQRRNAASAVVQAMQGVEVAKSGVTQAQAGSSQAQAGLAQAQATLEGAKASLVQIDLDIERLTVLAPFSGRIEKRFVEIGSSVNPGEILFTLADIDTMIAQARVSDKLRTTLSLGDLAQVRIGGDRPGVIVEGPITLIDSTSDGATRTFEVEIELENSITDSGQPKIVDNQFATVLFSQAAEQLFRIPQSALTSASLSAQPDGATGLLTIDANNQVIFTEVSFADYNDGGELLVRADRLGESPIRLIVGRGGFVSIGDEVDARKVLEDLVEGS